VSLSVHHTPVCVTFSLFEKGQKHALDPCKAEEMVQEGNITLVLNPHRELCTMFLAGGVPLDVEKIMMCSSVAASKAGEIAKLIKASTI
jgi:exosome complex component RRP45